jgi:hypothetical protein
LTLVAAACSSPQPRRDPPVDCAQEDLYEFASITPAYWFTFGDDAPGAYDGSQHGVALNDEGEYSTPPEPTNLALLAARPDSSLPSPTPRCAPGDNPDLFLKTYGHVDWGSAWGSELKPRAAPYKGNGTEDPITYEGVSFWARSERRANKGVTLEVDTAQTAKPSDGEVEDPDDCKQEATEEGALIYQIDAAGNQIVVSGAPDPDQCGNPFRRLVFTTDRWELYLFPFDSFWQQALPTRVSTGMDASKIYSFRFRAEKESFIEMWIDSLSFYRRKGWVPPGGLMEDPTPGAGGEAGDPDADGAEMPQ